MERRIVVSGYYGSKNAGDEAMLAAMLEVLGDLDPKLHITVISASPADTSERHGVESISWLGIPSIIKALWHADLLISGGGSLLQNVTSRRSLYYYLAIIFLAVSNTVLGVQFLMSQRRTGRRYRTLVRLGAAYETLCRSARKQINWFVGLPVFVAAVGSMFGIRALFSGILSASAQTSQKEMLLVSAFVILLLCVVEYIYMTVIKRSSDRYLLTLMEPQREE